MSATERLPVTTLTIHFPSQVAQATASGQVLIRGVKTAFEAFAAVGGHYITHFVYRDVPETKALLYALIEENGGVVGSDGVTYI